MNKRLKMVLYKEPNKHLCIFGNSEHLIGRHVDIRDEKYISLKTDIEHSSGVLIGLESELIAPVKVIVDKYELNKEYVQYVMLYSVTDIYVK